MNDGQQYDDLLPMNTRTIVGPVHAGPPPPTAGCPDTFALSGAP
jgi:hypothetical protein